MFSVSGSDVVGSNIIKYVVHLSLDFFDSEINQFVVCGSWESIR